MSCGIDTRWTDCRQNATSCVRSLRRKHALWMVSFSLKLSWATKLTSKCMARLISKTATLRPTEIVVRYSRSLFIFKKWLLALSMAPGCSGSNRTEQQHKLSAIQWSSSARCSSDAYLTDFFVVFLFIWVHIDKPPIIVQLKANNRQEISLNTTETLESWSKMHEKRVFGSVERGM